MNQPQNIIIVGASSGLGRELTKLFVRNGCRVGITARREDKLDRIKQMNPSDISVNAFDCTKDKNIEGLLELVSNVGGMDLLIFSAGTGDLNESLCTEIEEGTIMLNVKAFTEISVWAYNYFISQGSGHLVAISSIAGLRGGRIAPSYNASKAYQINYLEGLRQKAKKSGLPIFVTDIRPGFVDTAMAKGDQQFWVAPPEKAAKQIFYLIKRKKDFGYVTKRWWLIAIISKSLPDWIHKGM
ncbi:MAG: SDR family NAD(P)-dependent oxidoreductase [Maribacter sp.]